MVLKLGHFGKYEACPESKHTKVLKLLIYLLAAIGLTLGVGSTVHMYTQTIHRTIQNKQYIEQHNNLEECGL